MKNRLVPFVVLVAVCSGLNAQIVKLSGTRAFSSEAVSLSFTGPGDGAEVANLFSEWGVRFSGGGVPRVRKLVPEFTSSSDFSVLRNECVSGSPASVPLVVNFEFPVRRVGFSLGNGDPSVRAAITVFDAVGNLLGGFEQARIDDFIGPFVAFEAVGEQGISKIVVNYGEAERGEQMSRLMFEYVSPAKFTSFIPQVGDGRFPAGALRTMIVLSNPTSEAAKAEVRLFGDGGQPLSLVFEDGSLSSGFEVTLRAWSSRILTTAGLLYPAASGYARVEANVPVQATAIFRVVDRLGNLVSEVGISATSAKVLAVGPAQKSAAGAFDSGLALVNTADKEATLRVALIDRGGRTPKDAPPVVMRLPAGGHAARFVSELFPLIAMGDFEGSIRVTSDQAVAISILRTRAGLPVSSLAVGSSQR